MAGDHRHDGQRVEQAAVDQHAVALHHRGKQAGNRRRGPHCLMQAAFLKPDFLLVGQVRGHGGVRDTQVFDVDLANDVANLTKHFFPTNGAQAKANVHQPQHIEIVQTLNPVAVQIKLARRVDAPHHGPHRATGNAGDVVATAFEFLNDANVGVPSGATRAQHQCNALFHESILGQ